MQLFSSKKKSTFEYFSLWIKLGCFSTAVVLLCLIASDSYACAVCGATRPESKNAFIVTTGLLTTIPLLLIGGGAYLLRRKYRTHQIESEKKT